jgi:EAL domain-containing protein (putative c-di-GMP-specific phosphodiesterase class I)
MRRQAVAPLHLETDMRVALERGEFRIHYQPIVTLKDGMITGVEALLRWQHPHRGSIPPLEFIPLAEETGLIIPIGEWVLRTTCSQLRAWRDEGIGPLRMAVNISAVQLRDPGFADLGEMVIREAGIKPDAFELELTETILMSQTKAIVDELLRLRSFGVHISIDDFGTGYSSLNYLQNFPVDTLKIDRSFINKLAANGDQRKIIETILMLGDKLGLEVVAEGIETAEQLANLLAINCRRGQGYFFAKPMEGRALRPLFAALPKKME